MAHSDKVSVIGPMVEAYIKSRGNELGLRDVWYGDDDHIPETPAVLVTPGPKNREISATSHVTMTTFNFSLTLFHSRFTDPRITRQECDEKAEQLEEILHENRYLDGNLLHSYVSSMEFGVASRGNVLMKATRLSWVANSRTRI